MPLLTKYDYKMFGICFAPFEVCNSTSPYKNWANIIYYFEHLIRNVSNVVLMESNAVVFVYFEICTTHHERE